MTSDFDQQVQGFSATEPVDFYSQARNIALRQLSHSAKSRAQLVAVLAKRGIPEDCVIQVLDELTQLGWVDDLAFAHLLVRSRCASKKVSRSRLRQQLKAKRIAPEYIEIALADVTDEQQEQMAMEVALRKVRQLSDRPRDVIERRTYQLLLRKGYSFALSAKVLRKVLSDSETR